MMKAVSTVKALREELAAWLSAQAKVIRALQERKNILNGCDMLERIVVEPKLFANRSYLKETFPVQLFRLIEVRTDD